MVWPEINWLSRASVLLNVYWKDLVATETTVKQDCHSSINVRQAPTDAANQGQRIIVAMTLLIRNEEDIIEDNILFHYAQGVDVFVIMDNLSTDRTKDIVLNLSKEISIDYIYQSKDDYSQGQWVTSMARKAKADYNADWVINSDADEFWAAANGNTLKEALRGISRDCTALLIDRHNAILERRANIFAGLSAHPQSSLAFERRSRNALGKPLPSKCLHRGSDDVIVHQGNHCVDGIGGEIKSTTDIRIFHFPYRSFKQYKSKILLGGSAYQRNATLPVSAGATWREHYKLLDSPEFLTFWENLHISTSELAMSELAGDVLSDQIIITCLNQQHQKRASNYLERAIGVLDLAAKESVASFCEDHYERILKLPAEARDSYPYYQNLRFALSGARRHEQLIHSLSRKIDIGNVLSSFAYLRDVFSLYPKNSSAFAEFLGEIIHIKFPSDVATLRNLVHEKNIILHVSCAKRLDRAMQAVGSFSDCGEQMTNIVVVGEGEALSQDQIPLQFRLENQILYIPVSDSYEALATKVFYALTIISLAGVPRYVVKLDDDIRLDSINVFGQYLDSLSGLGVSYAGRAVGSLCHADQWHGWHLGKCSDPLLHSRGYQFPTPPRYAAGGYGYVLGAKGLDACRYMFLAMKSFFDVDSMGMEDMYVGHAMNASNISLYSKGIVMPSLALPGLRQVV